MTLVSFYHYQKTLRITFLNKIEEWIKREERRDSSSSNSNNSDNSSN